MIREKFTQVVVIQTTDGAEYQRQFNEIMRNLAEAEVTYETPANVPGHCCYIYYKEEIVTPENAKDRLELKGITLVCGECPFYEEPHDGRRKKGRCRIKDDEPVWYEKTACNVMCEKVLSKEIVIKGVNDNDDF